MAIEGAYGLIAPGEPGDRWTNNTKYIYYQLRVQFRNSCAFCIMRAGLIARRWRIPFHEHCACTVSPLVPGDEASPYIDVMKRLWRMSRRVRRRVLGHGLYALVESGRIDLADVGAGGRVLSLREVARREGLTASAMKRAGVRPSLADAVWRDVGPETSAGRSAVRAQARRDRDLAEKARFESALARLRAKVADPGPPGSAVRPNAARMRKALRTLRASIDLPT